MGGGAEILVCEVTIRSDRNGEITQKNNYVYLIVQIFIRNLVICLYCATNATFDVGNLPLEILQNRPSP